MLVKGIYLGKNCSHFFFFFFFLHWVPILVWRVEVWYELVIVCSDEHFGWKKQTMEHIKWAPSSEFVSSSIPSWQILTAHAWPFRGAMDLAFCLEVPLDSLLVWASSGGSGETSRMRRLAWTFAARIGDKYQIRLTRLKLLNYCFNCSNRLTVWSHCLMMYPRDADRMENSIDPDQSWSEPPHDKTNKTTLRPAKTQISLGSEDSDQPGHPPSLIRVFAVRSIDGFFMRTLIRLGAGMPWLIWVFAGRADHFVVLSRGGSNVSIVSCTYNLLP